ncbi:Tetratricopeptide-like helical domain superfamily [Sesbania bispinosa]|nr:Tetratricopeptide-like helical domain superfamily [Sesbania bispinosa]
MAPDASDALAVRQKVQLFLNAARTGNLDLLKNLAAQLDEGKDLTKTVEAIKDANKRGALHFAAREGQNEVCKYLLQDLKLHVDSKDDDGETALIHAARQGHTATAKFLIDHGADPTIARDTELLEYLLSRGVNPDLESDAGTPLVWAAGHAQQAAVSVLLEHGANPNAETDDGITPLLSSVAAGSLACLELLIQAGAKVNISAGGATPLHIAADNGSLELINCLLKAGADPNISDEDGVKPIQVAAARGNRVAVEILFPLTSKIDTVPTWTIDGILEYMQSETKKQQDELVYAKETNQPKDAIREQNIPEVEPEAKRRAAEAKSRGDEAFKRKNYLMAIDSYTQAQISCFLFVMCLGVSMMFLFSVYWTCTAHAIDLNPTDATLLSNRSLCWIRLGQADHALADAKACRALRPDWPKACYREGAALRKFDEAANAFYEGVTLDPENKELVNAFREAVEAGRKFHGTAENKS